MDRQAVGFRIAAFDWGRTGAITGLYVLQNHTRCESTQLPRSLPRLGAARLWFVQAAACLVDPAETA